MNFIKFIGGQIVIFLIFIEFYIFGHHNSYEWVTTGDIPIILRLSNNDILNSDFFTNTVTGSPKIIFYYIIYLFYELFSVNLNDLLFIFKSIQIYLIPFLTYYVLIQFVKIKNIFLISAIFALIILFSTGFFDFILSFARIGFNSFTSWKDLSPQSFSFILGLTSLISYQKKLYKSSILILLFVSLIHIFSAIVFLTIFFIIFNNDEEKSNYLYYLLYKLLKIKYHLIVVFLIIFLMNYFFVNKLPHNFYEIYVLERHPHHYLFSSFFNFFSFLFISLPIIFIIIGVYKNNRFLLFQSLTILLFFYSCILCQFIGSEVLKINFFTLLGPARFLSVSIFLIFYLLVVTCNNLVKYE